MTFYYRCPVLLVTYYCQSSSFQLLIDLASMTPVVTFSNLRLLNIEKKINGLTCWVKVILDMVQVGEKNHAFTQKKRTLDLGMFF